MVMDSRILTTGRTDGRRAGGPLRRWRRRRPGGGAGAAAAAGGGLRRGGVGLAADRRRRPSTMVIRAGAGRHGRAPTAHAADRARGRPRGAPPNEVCGAHRRGLGDLGRAGLAQRQRQLAEVAGHRQLLGVGDRDLQGRGGRRRRLVGGEVGVQVDAQDADVLGHHLGDVVVLAGPSGVRSRISTTSTRSPGRAWPPTPVTSVTLMV